MTHYRLGIERRKIADCEEVPGIGEGYEYDMEGGFYYVRDAQGNVVSIICEADSKAQARRLTDELLASM